MTKAYPRDCQELGYCMSGTRQFFARHGLDFRDFVRNGIDAEKLLATDDEMARNVVERARSREAGQ